MFNLEEMLREEREKMQVAIGLVSIGLVSLLACFSSAYIEVCWSKLLTNLKLPLTDLSYY